MVALFAFIFTDDNDLLFVKSHKICAPKMDSRAKATETKLDRVEKLLNVIRILKP